MIQRVQRSNALPEPDWSSLGDLEALYKCERDYLYTDALMTIHPNDGDPVYRIDDLSGNGHIMEQSIASNRATFKVNQIDNGRDYLLFDGVDDTYLSINNVNPTPADGTVLGVMRRNRTGGPSTAAFVFIIGDGFAGTEYCTHIYSNQNNPVISRDASNNSGSSYNVEDWYADNVIDTAFSRIRRGGILLADKHFGKNGQVLTPDLIYDTGIPGSFGSRPIAFGRDFSGVLSFKGDLQFLVYYGNYITNAAINQIGQWLQARYNTPSWTEVTV